MKYLYFLVFLLFYVFGYSQSTKTIYLLDSISHEPVPFSNITIYEKETIKNGYYSDENGLAKITFDKNNSFKISCIGFETINIINFNDLKDTLYLKQNSIILNEVIVSNNIINKNLGFANLKKTSDISTFKGLEYALYIENESKENAKIRSVTLGVFKKSKNTAILKIKFYKKGIDNKPSDIINAQDIIYYLSEKVNGIIEIDISNKNVYLPENGVFVAVESLGFIDKNGSFIDDKDMWFGFRFFLIDNERNFTFIRNSLKTTNFHNDLKKMYGQSKMGLKFKNFPNVAIGIKVHE